MKIAGIEFDREYLGVVKRDLERLLAHPGPHKMRPCPGCDLECEKCGSRSCTCRCSQQCPFIAQVLSPEPDLYPIETKIVPLVYEMNCLGIGQTCWSCEGHMNGKDELANKPRVWFITRSLIYPKLVGEALTSLRVRKKIAYPWSVGLAYAGNQFDAAFSVEPDLDFESNPKLGLLQHDAQMIADNFCREVLSRARSGLQAISSYRY